MIRELYHVGVYLGYKFVIGEAVVGSDVGRLC